jgi:hypothetical protein
MLCKTVPAPLNPRIEDGRPVRKETLTDQVLSLTTERAGSEERSMERRAGHGVSILSDALEEGVDLLLHELEEL